MEIKPIRSEADYESAVAEIERLMDLDDLDEDAEDRLEVLASLVEEYEEEHFPIGAADPVEAIRFRMEQGAKTQADLATLLGSRSRASEVLGRRRGLSIDHIRRLHDEWGIPLESLVGGAEFVAEKPARYGAKRRNETRAAKRSKPSSGGKKRPPQRPRRRIRKS